MRDVNPLDLEETIREGTLVLEPDLTIRIASRSFYDTFAVASEQAVGPKVYEIGNGGTFPSSAPRSRPLSQAAKPSRHLKSSMSRLLALSQSHDLLTSVARRDFRSAWGSPGPQPSVFSSSSLPARLPALVSHAALPGRLRLRHRRPRRGPASPTPARPCRGRTELRGRSLCLGRSIWLWLPLLRLWLWPVGRRLPLWRLRRLRARPRRPQRHGAELLRRLLTATEERRGPARPLAASQSRRGRRGCAGDAVERCILTMRLNDGDGGCDVET